MERLLCIPKEGSLVDDTATRAVDNPDTLLAPAAGGREGDMLAYYVEKVYCKVTLQTSALTEPGTSINTLIEVLHQLAFNCPPRATTYTC